MESRKTLSLRLFGKPASTARPTGSPVRACPFFGSLSPQTKNEATSTTYREEEEEKANRGDTGERRVDKAGHRKGGPPPIDEDGTADAERDGKKRARDKEKKREKENEGVGLCLSLV
ncbi:UNVERIFIED_CONTAM: hypothetical protein HHA_449090 [Hammondia hammondi]|eukprot:XP_008881660.1 hypothetical protein HHA_449090 [Hammondia hammondi]